MLARVGILGLCSGWQREANVCRCSYFSHLLTESVAVISRRSAILNEGFLLTTDGFEHTQ